MIMQLIITMIIVYINFKLMDPLYLCFFDREISRYNWKSAILEYSIVHKQMEKIYEQFSATND